MTSMPVGAESDSPAELGPHSADGLVRRFAYDAVALALSDTRIVVMEGGRQVGKSTLASVVAPTRGGVVVSLDNRAARASAASDPTSFVRQNAAGLLVIDELQHVPDLLLAVKAEVDARRAPGQFLLTGSADLLSLRGADSLAGRAETIVLEGFSQGELTGVRETFLDRAFAGDTFIGHHSILQRGDYIERASVGGFPEVVARESGPRRGAWFADYLRRLTRRDAPDIAGLQRLEDLPRLAAYVAATAGSQFVMASAASDLGVPRTTLGPYATVLADLYVTRTLPAWSTSAVARAIKHPKVFIRDSGLAAHLLGVTPTSLRTGGPHEARAGIVLETFVVSELAKQAAWSKSTPDLSHFRDQAGREVDVIAHTRDGGVVGVEVKASAGVTARDFRTLARLRDLLGEDFRAGIVLYTGERTMPFGPSLAAVPMDALWSVEQ
jgi:predicted AAA+ superfamily ATPase